MANVKLILVESIHRLGEAGDLVSVKPGFARNFLLPQGKALLATEGAREGARAQEADRRGAGREGARSDLQAVKRQLEALRIEIGARAGDSGKLFGSVTAAQIADALEAAGIPIDRRRIDLREPIKEVGDHKVTVRLLRELTATLTIHVVAEAGPPPEEEAPRGRARRPPPRRRRDDDDDEDDDDERAGGDEDSTRATRVSGKMALRSHRQGVAVARSSRSSRASSTGSDRADRERRRSDASRRTTSRPRRRCSRRCCSTTSRSTRCSTKSSPTTSTIRRTRSIYRAMLALQDENEPVDLHTLSDHLNAAKTARPRRRARLPLRALRLRGHRRQRRAPRAHRARQGGQAQPDPRLERDRRGVLRAGGARRASCSTSPSRRSSSSARRRRARASRRSTAACTTRWTTSSC